MSYDSLGMIARPLHVLGIRSAAEYESKHKRQMQKLLQLFPELGLPGAPYDVDWGGVAIVSGGKWVVRCVCNNAPSADPEWDIARCFTCGRIWRFLTWPSEREAIEAALVVRPSENRNWEPPETLEDLLAENLAMDM